MAGGRLGARTDRASPVPEEKAFAWLFLAGRRNHSEIIHRLDINGNKCYMPGPVIIINISRPTNLSGNSRGPAWEVLGAFLGVWTDSTTY